MSNKKTLTEQIQTILNQYEEEHERERNEYEDRIFSLEAEIKTLSERDIHSVPLDRLVADPQLRERLSRLGDSPPLDTVIREAGVVLENRIKTIGEVPKAYGSRMIESLMDPKNGTLIFSDNPNEQGGVLNLYLGALQFIRNPPMHKLIEYPEHTARILIKLVDALLQLLEEANPKKEISLAAVRHLLTRIRVPNGQIALYKALYDAGETGLTNTELVEIIGKTRQGLAGVLGALGNRINKTPGFESQGNINAVFDITPASYGDYRYKMRPILKEALEIEGIFNKYDVPKPIQPKIEKNITARNISYYAFFEELSLIYWSKFAKGRKPKAQYQSWFSFGGGKSGVVFGWSFRNEERFSAEILMYTSDDPEQNVDYMEQLKLAIPVLPEGLQDLEWETLPGKRACRIVIYRPGEITTISSDQDLQDENIAWGIEKMRLLEETFREPIKQLKP